MFALQACAALAGLILLLVCAFLLQESWPALRNVGFTAFVTDAAWHPTARLAQFNLLPMLWGSLASTLGAILLATPLAVLSAVFCHYYAPAVLRSLYRRMLELLAGIPSVVYGFWGLVMLVPMIRELHPPGPSLLAGILILTLMILPTIALMADAALSALPSQYARTAASLGLSRWTTIRRVLLPAARGGISAAVILGTGRAIGETMAILMVCGNLVQTPDSLFSPIRTLTANIALEMAYALGTHRSALFVSGLLLVTVIVLLTLLTGRFQRQTAVHS